MAGQQIRLSLLELIELVDEFTGRKVRYSCGEWRTGDQRVFICDIRKAANDFGWKPMVSVNEGLGELIEWVYRSEAIIREVVETEAFASGVR